MEKRVDDGYLPADLLRKKQLTMLCVGRCVRTAPMRTPYQVLCFDDDEVPQGSDFLTLLCDPLDGPASFRNQNLKFQQFLGYQGLRNIPQQDQTTELSAQPLVDTKGIAASDQESDYSMSSY